MKNASTSPSSKRKEKNQWEEHVPKTGKEGTLKYQDLILFAVSHSTGLILSNYNVHTVTMFTTSFNSE
jgi:hypothetical protein